MKKLTSLLLAVCLLATVSMNAFATETPADGAISVADENLGEIISTTVEGNIVRTEYELTDVDAIEALIDSGAIEVPDGAIPSKIITTIVEELPSEEDTAVYPVPYAYYLTSVSNAGNVYFSDETLSVSTYGPGGTASKSISQAVAVKKSLSISVSDSILTAGVGYDVTNTFTVSDTYTHTVTAGKRAQITARTLYTKTTFSVYNTHLLGSDTYEGTGAVYKPVGVRFEYVEYN